jgi:hypothetical protein
MFVYVPLPTQHETHLLDLDQQLGDVFAAEMHIGHKGGGGGRKCTDLWPSKRYFQQIKSGSHATI